jgi:hypothetical protein
MAEPSLELDASLSSEPTTYDQAIINNNTYDTTKVIRWAAAGSSDGSLGNVQLPSTGNDKWADELWLEDTDGTDVLLVDDDEQPDAATQKEMTFRMYSDAAYATAPRVTVFDDNTHTDTEEFIDGTTNDTSPMVKARGQTTYTAPPQYWGEASDETLHHLDNAGSGAVTMGDATGNQENQALDGMNDYLLCSTTALQTTTQYFALALSLPDDATTGTDVINGVLSIRYTYT